MSSSRTLSRKFRTFFICIKPRFDPSIILLYIAASVEQYCDITQVNALPQNEGILEFRGTCYQQHTSCGNATTPKASSGSWLHQGQRTSFGERSQLSVPQTGMVPLKTVS